MASQIVDKTKQALRHFRVFGVADEHRMAPPDRQEALGHADAAALDEREIHVDADIALAQWQYWLASEDKAWLQRDG